MDWKNRSAYVFIKTKKGKADEVWKKFHDWDNVIGTWLVDGEWDVIVWLDTNDWDSVHNHIVNIKNWDEVENTSSHMVYNGYKNDSWWWEKPAGAWVLFKENKLDEANEKIKNWSWTPSGASIAGKWDYLAWVEGQNWNEVWDHIYQIKTENMETATIVPIKSWWNQNWKDNWW